MKPFQAVAMGTLIVVLVVAANGYDLLPDPLGWLLVLVGLGALPGDFPRRRLLLALGTVALLASVPLWFPAVPTALAEADEALVWAADLPRFAFFVAMAWTAGEAAAGARTGSTRGSAAVAWFRVTAGLGVLAAVLPVLVFGAGVDGIRDVAGTVGEVPILLVILLFWYSDRPWALPAETAGTTQTTTPAPPARGGKDGRRDA